MQTRNAMQSQWIGGSLQILPPEVTGNCYFVDSNTGASTNSGATWSDALDTIDHAINKCTDSQGDIVFVHPEHAETISGAAAIAVDVIGVSIIGIKRGDNMPTITLGGTDAATTIGINADGVLLKDLAIVGGDTDGTTRAVDIKTGSDFVTLDGLMFYETANTTEILGCITLEDKTDYCTIRNCTFRNLASGDNTDAIITEADEHAFLTIENCTFVGDWTNAVLDLDAGNIVFPVIRNCLLVNYDATAGDAIDTASGTKALIVDCRIASGKGDAYPLGDTTAAFVLETYGAEANTYGVAATIATGANFGS